MKELRKAACPMPRAEKKNTDWEELQLLTSREIPVEVEHVKAHRTKKDKKEMSTSSDEKADELAKVGAMLEEGFMTDARA